MKSCLKIEVMVVWHKEKKRKEKKVITLTNCYGVRKLDQATAFC